MVIVLAEIFFLKKFFELYKPIKWEIGLFTYRLVIGPYLTQLLSFRFSLSFYYFFFLFLKWSFYLDNSIFVLYSYFFYIISYLKFYINSDIIFFYSYNFDIFVYPYYVHIILRIISC